MGRRTLVAAQSIMLTTALVVVVLTSHAADWQPAGLVAFLAILAIASDAMAIETASMRLTGSFIAIVLAIVGSAAGFAIGKGAGPSWNELRRYEALSGREGEIRGRDAGWNQGRKQGRTELQFLAQYEKLRTQATAFNQGYTQGRTIGQNMGRDSMRYRGYGYGGYGYGRGYRGYGYGGYGYGGRVGGSIASAQAIANATGSPVDVIVN